MSHTGLYGPYLKPMTDVMQRIVSQIESCCTAYESQYGEKLYEHMRYRIKSEESMIEKLEKRGLEPTARNALKAVNDAIGLRIICLFIDGVYKSVEHIKALPGCTVVREKDYIKNAKPNGYRSYHMVLDVESPEADIDNNSPGHYYVEIQLRTIAMDTWAALEHELKYKKNISNPELITQELHRCANELAACDVSMQTLKQLIREM